MRDYLLNQSPRAYALRITCSFSAFSLRIETIENDKPRLIVRNATLDWAVLASLPRLTGHLM